ncbi:MAG TPA: RNA polymerase sigma factor SigJ [Thermoanaerobaculia bacterium]|nr:RNA polymerase sigma factor SigJ [Thermoanaerobaculia bacterium]
MAEDDRGVSEFETYRSLLFSVAYRMLGSVAEAEDLVQDAYIRYASADRDIVRDVKAFLVTILTRLALDRLKSAQAQRETYIGPWLPEPVVTEGDDPLARALREERVQYALLRAMEKLSPSERAVLLLADVLEHDHNEIAEILDISAASSRQLLHRARERVNADKSRFTPTREEQQRLIRGFMAAIEAGDIDSLRGVLASSVTAGADGGGRVPGAGVHPIVGPDKVARLYLGLAAKFGPGLRGEVLEITGEPALVLFDGDSLLGVMVFSYDEGRIGGLHTILNPEKLVTVRRQSAAFHHQEHGS